MAGIRVLLVQTLNTVAGLGFFAPLVFIPVYVVGTAFFVPIVALAFAAGALLDFPTGFAVSLISSLAGASGGFFAGRYLSRKWVLRKVASNQKIKALDNAVAEKGWKIVLLVRLSPVFPFMLVNYGLGLSKISFRRYILATSIGMIPGTLLYVYLGSLAGKLVFEAGQIKKTPLEWAFIAFGFAMVVGMAVYSALIVKKILQTSEKYSSESGPRQAGEILIKRGIYS